MTSLVATNQFYHQADFKHYHRTAQSGVAEFLTPAGLMLDNIGSYINPLRLIERIPEGMVVDHLRDRLVVIIAEFRSQTSLKQCCSNILQKDCLSLAQVCL